MKCSYSLILGMINFFLMDGRNCSSSRDMPLFRARFILFFWLANMRVQNVLWPLSKDVCMYFIHMFVCGSVGGVVVYVFVRNKC